MNKVTVTTLKTKKQNKEKIIALTAYDFYVASLLDELKYDIILVGDSAAMVFAGYETTLPITMEEMLYHTKAVTRAVKHSLVVADMPFLSYQVSKEQAIENAGRFLKEAGANAVKLEGGQKQIHIIDAVINAGIPVMGHIGLMPQSVNKTGGYKQQGKTEEQAEKLILDAMCLEKAGCFSIVLECIPSQLAKKITQKIKIPTIGIGAGKDCDGQILVTNDLLGYKGNVAPKFVKQYANIHETFQKAFQNFKIDIENGKFPC